MTEITIDVAARVLEVVDAGLVAGLGTATPGEMCVEAAVCYALGLPHGDNPPCVAPAVREAKIVLNDASWTSPQARAQGLRKLAILQLGTAGVLNEAEFSKRLAMFAVTQQLPRALRLAGLDYEADLCASASGLVTAAEAAQAAALVASAASWAARTASWSAEVAARSALSAEGAARAARAARSAAVASASLSMPASLSLSAEAAWAAWALREAAAAELIFFADGMAQILVDMGVPGVAFLPLLNTEATQ